MGGGGEYLCNGLTNAKFSIEGEKAKEKEKDKHSSTSSVSSKSSISSAGTTNGGSQQNCKTEPTWVHDIFEGILTNETRCLCCETVSLVQYPDWMLLETDVVSGMIMKNCHASIVSRG